MGDDAFHAGTSWPYPVNARFSRVVLPHSNVQLTKNNLTYVDSTRKDGAEERLIIGSWYPDLNLVRAVVTSVANLPNTIR